MYLLQPKQLDIDQLDNRISELHDFEISIEKRQVEQLVESYEARSTRTLIDVNTGEDDIVRENSDKTLNEKEKLMDKIKHVKETIVILKQRKIEQQKKLDFLSAPQKAKKKQKEEQKNDRKVSLYAFCPVCSYSNFLSLSIMEEGEIVWDGADIPNGPP